MVTGEDLTADLQELAEELGEVPTSKQMNSEGPHWASAYQEEFGSWNNALESAGLSVERERNIEEGKLIDEIKRLAEELGEVPTSDQMDSDGGHSAKTYERRFGSWNAALEAAGFPPNVNTDTTRAELLDEIDQLADELGRPPTTKDMTEEGRFGVNTYLRTIGSFVQARCEAGHAIHKTVEVECEHCGQIVEKTESDVQEYEHHFCCRDCYSEWKSNVGQDHPLSEKVEVACDWCGDRLLRKPHKARDNERHFCDRGCMAEFRTDRIGEDALAWKGGHDTYRYYGPNWDSQRQKALERDGYCCQSCGSVESELDCGLHVHHITPLREFGDGSATDYKIANALENLVSLCAECHPKWENIPVRPSVTRTATE